MAITIPTALAAALAVALMDATADNQAGKSLDDALDYPPVSSGWSWAASATHIYQEANYGVENLSMDFPGLAAMGPSAPPHPLGLLPGLGPDSVTGIEDVNRTTSAYLE